MAPRYGRLSETDLGKKSLFFWKVHNTEFSAAEYRVEVRGRPPTKSKLYRCPSIRTMRCFACLRMVIERALLSGGFWSMLSAPETSCVFWPSWVSPQVGLPGAPDQLPFKPFS